MIYPLIQKPFIFFKKIFKHKTENSTVAFGDKMRKQAAAITVDDTMRKVQNEPKCLPFPDRNGITVSATADEYFTVDKQHIQFAGCGGVKHHKCLPFELVQPV